MVFHINITIEDRAQEHTAIFFLHTRTSSQGQIIDQLKETEYIEFKRISLVDGMI